MLEQLKTLQDTLYELIKLIMHPTIIIPSFIIFYIFYRNNKKYKEESYYKITKINYHNVRKNIGRYGEYLTYKYLKHFEDQGAKFLFNLYIPKNGNETTEIDVLMISCKGLFVFESKNYSGWIFGNNNQKFWYQTLPSRNGNSHKEKFYNPVFQNNTHVKYLKLLIEYELPIYSIITFSDRCTLMDININKSNVYVINRYHVRNLIETIYDKYDDILSTDQINKIYNKLYPYTQVDNITKQKHINTINDNIQKNVIENTEEEIIQTKQPDQSNNHNNNNTTENNK